MSLAYDPDLGEAMVFAGGKWTRHLEGVGSCSNGGSAYSTITAEFPLPLPPQDPIPVLTGSGVADWTGGCLGTSHFDEKYERTGD